MWKYWIGVDTFSLLRTGLPLLLRLVQNPLLYYIKTYRYLKSAFCFVCWKKDYELTPLPMLGVQTSAGYTVKDEFGGLGSDGVSHQHVQKTLLLAFFGPGTLHHTKYPITPLNVPFSLGNLSFTSPAPHHSQGFSPLSIPHQQMLSHLLNIPTRGPSVNNSSSITAVSATNETLLST